MRKLFSFFLLFLIFSSCATPTVINVIGPNDNKLSCEELSTEIAIANEYADKARDAKKMSKPHNIGALLFFFPGAGFTIHNVEEAERAAKDRALHLNKLKEKNNC